MNTNRPDRSVMAISNVFCRLMHFKKAGEVELGHYHNYDHGTLISSGEILIEMLDEKENVIASKKFIAPQLAFISKDKKHRLTALKDNSVAVCIHALRDIDSNILSPEFFISHEQVKEYMSKEKSWPKDIENLIANKKPTY